jgi:hypothetical protein
MLGLRKFRDVIASILERDEASAARATVLGPRTAGSNRDQLSRCGLIRRDAVEVIH